MNPSRVRAAMVAHKAVPLASLEAFLADPRDAAAAESYLRRAVEALLDLARHVLAKALGEVSLESKQIAVALCRGGRRGRRSR